MALDVDVVLADVVDEATEERDRRHRPADIDEVLALQRDRTDEALRPVEQGQCDGPRPAQERRTRRADISTSTVARHEAPSPTAAIPTATDQMSRQPGRQSSEASSGGNGRRRCAPSATRSCTSTRRDDHRAPRAEDQCGMQRRSMTADRDRLLSGAPLPEHLVHRRVRSRRLEWVKSSTTERERRRAGTNCEEHVCPTSSYRCSTKPLPFLVCSRRSRADGTRSSSTTVPPTTPLPWRARWAPTSCTSPGAVSAPRASPDCAPPTSTWSRSWTATAHSMVTTCCASRSRSSIIGVTSCSAPAPRSLARGRGTFAQPTGTSRARSGVAPGFG